MIKREIKLNNEMFNALVNGKKLQDFSPELELTIYPPHYGLYITIEQLKEIKMEAYKDGAMSLVNLLNNL